MRKVWTVALGVSLLAGCASQPVGPQTREGWTALHTHELKGVTVEQVLNASQKVLELADHDFKFDFPKNRLIASRRWMIYAVLAASMGVDYWQIDAEPTADGVSVTVQISRQAGAVMPSPTIGVTGASQGNIGVGASATTMPGDSISAPFPYELFWKRLDYLLGRSSSWTTCKEAEAGKTSREKFESETLCSVTTDDRSP